jgi:hypothetical protein
MGMKIDIDSVYAARKEAEERRIQIQVQIKDLEAEDAAVSVDLEEYEITIRTLHRIAPDLGPHQSEVDEEGGILRGTARRLIENALNTFSRDGKSAGEIREYINTRFGVEIAPNTLSVTLNRLKAAGLAKLVSQKWQPATPSDGHTSTSAGWEDLDIRPAVSDLDDEIPF